MPPYAASGATVQPSTLMVLEPLRGLSNYSYDRVAHWAVIFNGLSHEGKV